MKHIVGESPCAPVVEALLVLIRDLNVLMAEEWSDRPQAEVRHQINAAIAKALDTAI